MEFLTNGKVSGGLTAYGTESNDYDTIRGCFDSSDCAAGWSCFGGRCRQPGSIGTNIQTISGVAGTRYGSSSASCPTDETDTGVPFPDINDCGGGGGYGYGGGQTTGGCDKPGCTNSPGSDGNSGAHCCGERCCRFSSTGASTGLRVQCYCGPCPPPKRCQKWCDTFKKVNGRDGEGCSDATSCSECETCVTILGGQIAECKPITIGAPCHCGGSNACRGACNECKSDGTCEENCANCESCVTMYNTNCGCAYVSTRCCTSACSTGSLSWVGCKNKACESACPPGDGPEKDPCEGVCTTRTYCEEGPPPDCDTPPCATPPGSPSCPPDSSCTNLGFISAGGETCYLEKVCDKSGLPSSCSDSECNCHADCGDCEICNSTGTCQQDPRCVV